VARDSVWPALGGTVALALLVIGGQLITSRADRARRRRAEALAGPDPLP
jgi:hypothetical protein